jgi:uncharacterized protein with von Willebrand factor type A (vWA) domain
MKFRTGLLVGLAVGYYYGAKAGRERYEQIDDVLLRLRQSVPYQRMRAAADDLMDEGRGRAFELIDGMVDRPAYQGPTRTTTFDAYIDPTLN